MKNPESKTNQDSLPGEVTSAACEPEGEGLNADSALWPERDQVTHLPCDWIFSIPNFFLRQGLGDVNVRPRLLHEI